MKRFAHRFLVISLLAAGLPGIAMGDGESGPPTIVTKSPFLPPDFNPPGGAGAAGAAAPASASQYEFRGVYQMEGTYYFNLYNTRDRKGTWVTENAAGTDAPRIIRYDRQEDVLEVDVAGERVSLNMVETSNKPLPMANTRPARPKPAQATTAANASQKQPSRPTTVRRRVIRPTTRNQSTSSARRPTVPANPSQKQNP
jgi:hypothetical protein